MNKKYIELAERAGFSLWGKESWNPGDVIDWSARYDKELESFADMIVRECAEICLEANDHKNILRHFELIGPYKEVQDATLKDAVMQIKQHFGVE